MNEISINTGAGPGPYLIIRISSGIDDLVLNDGKGLFRIDMRFRW